MSEAAYNATELMIINAARLLQDGDHRGAYFEHDYSVINEAYFDAAEEKLKVLEKYHMTPVLVLLWGNYYGKCLPVLGIMPRLKQDIFPCAISV